MFKYRNLKDGKAQFSRLASAIGPSKDGVAQDEFVTLEDDFGHMRALWAMHIQNVALIDMEKDMDSQADMAVWQARGQAAAQRKIQTDPRLGLMGGMQGQSMGQLRQ